MNAKPTRFIRVRNYMFCRSINYDIYEAIRRKIGEKDKIKPCRGLCGVLAPMPIRASDSRDVAIRVETHMGVLVVPLNFHPG